MSNLFDEAPFLLIFLEFEFEAIEDFESGWEYVERFRLKALVYFFLDDFSFEFLWYFVVAGVGECKFSKLVKRGALGAN